MRKLKDWINAFVDFCENSEPPTTYKKWVGVSVVAAALQRKCLLNWGYLTFYPNMYIVLVGPAGKTRKGTAMTPGYHLLRDVGIKIAAEATTREALIQELRRSVDTATVNGSAPVIHSSLTIYSQELTVFLGTKNTQLIMDLTDWYDCRDRWVYRTKNMGVDEITGVWVNLIGATTPELIRTALPRDAIGGGLTSRMIFIYEDKKGKIVPHPQMTADLIKLYNDLLDDLQMIHQMAGEFTVTPSFVKAWEAWYTSQSRVDLFPGIHELNSYVERRANHVMKLSMILSASRSDEMIVDVQDLERAVGMLEEIEIKMPKVFAGVGQSPTSDVAERIIQHVGLHSPTTVRDLFRIFFRDVGDRKAFLDLMSSIEYSGAIKMETRENGDIIVRSTIDDFKAFNKGNDR